METDRGVANTGGRKNDLPSQPQRQKTKGRKNEIGKEYRKQFGLHRGKYKHKKPKNEIGK
jgi:hypothetical protein